MNGGVIVPLWDLRWRERLLFLALLLVFACTDRQTQTGPPASRSVFAVADSLRTFGAAEPALALYHTLRDSLAGVNDSAGVWKATLWSGYCLMRWGGGTVRQRC